MDGLTPAGGGKMRVDAWIWAPLEIVDEAAKWEFLVEGKLLKIFWIFKEFLIFFMDFLIF